MVSVESVDKGKDKDKNKNGDKGKDGDNGKDKDKNKDDDKDKDKEKDKGQVKDKDRRSGKRSKKSGGVPNVLEDARRREEQETSVVDGYNNWLRQVSKTGGWVGPVVHWW